MLKSFILPLISIVSINTAIAQSTLTTTYISKFGNPSKATIVKAQARLAKALVSTSETKIAKELDAARKLLAKKTINVKYDAAIVVSDGEMTDPELVNLSEYESFLESVDTLCFNGKIETALKVANLLSNDIWIYDEYELDSISMGDDGSSINFNVIDLFSYDDQNASEEDRADFIETYSASSCK